MTAIKEGNAKIKSPIQENMSLLHGELDLLKNLIEKIRDRLKPISKPSIPNDENKIEDTPKESYSPIVNDVKCFQGVVYIMKNISEDILNRLEV